MTGFETVNPVVIVISRDEVEGRVASSALGALKSCLSSPAQALSFFEKLDIAFHGYDNDPRELFEIPEVRNYVSRLDIQFPFWLFFLTKDGSGLQCIMFCLMPPYLTEEARKTVLPQRLDDLLSGRWFPAMNHICELVGFSERRIENLTDRVADYFINAPSTLAT
jgi:hypothetical protein